MVSRRTSLIVLVAVASLHISLAQRFRNPDYDADSPYSPGNLAPRCLSGWIVSDWKTTDKCFTFSNGPQDSDSPLQCIQPLHGNGNAGVGNSNSNPFGSGNNIGNGNDHLSGNRNSIRSRGISWCCPPPDQKLCSAGFRWSEEGNTNICYHLTGHCCC